MRTKAIFPAVIAVAAGLITIVGAGSASATGLCKVEESPCKAANAYASGQTYTATSTAAVLENSLETVTCSEASTTLKQTSANTSSGVALPGEVTALSFSKCVASTGFGCEVRTRNLGYSAGLQLGAVPGGKLTVVKKLAEPQVSVSCAGGFFKCIFGAEPILEVKGGNPATVDIKKLKLNVVSVEGFIDCPKEAFWTAKYTGTTPKPVFVSAS